MTSGGGHEHDGKDGVENERETKANPRDTQGGPQGESAGSACKGICQARPEAAREVQAHRWQAGREFETEEVDAEATPEPRAQG